MKKIAFWAAIACLCNSLLWSSLVNAEVKSAAQKLAGNFAELTSYQANFEQRVQNENGKLIDSSSGRFTLQKPDHFRWEIKQPFEQLIVADGNHIFTYETDLEQVTIQNQSKLLADSPLLLLTSDAQQLERTFAITEVSPSAEVQSTSEGKQLFLLKPKGDGGIFESVHILFDQGQLVELLMQDSLGQQTSVEFSQVKLNARVDAALFSFIMPQGVDVIDSRERVVEHKQNDKALQSANHKP